MYPIKFKLQNPPAWLVLALFILVPIFWLSIPIFTINAINTLFGTEIPINFWTWLSALWLQALVTYRSSSNN